MHSSRRTLVKYAHSRCAYGRAKLVKCRAATCQIQGAVTGQIQKAVTGQIHAGLTTSRLRAQGRRCPFWPPQKGASLVKKGASLVKKGADGSRGATRSDTAPRRYTLVKRFTGQKGRQKKVKKGADGGRGATRSDAAPRSEALVKRRCGPVPAFIIYSQAEIGARVYNYE